MSRPPPSGNGEAGSTDGAGGPGNTGTVIAGNGEATDGDPTTATCTVVGGNKGTVGNCTTVR